MASENGEHLLMVARHFDHGTAGGAQHLRSAPQHRQFCTFNIDLDDTGPDVMRRRIGIQRCRVDPAGLQFKVSALCAGVPAGCCEIGVEGIHEPAKVFFIEDRFADLVADRRVDVHTLRAAGDILAQECLVLLAGLKDMDLTGMTDLSGKELGKKPDMAPHLEHDIRAAGQLCEPLHRRGFAMFAVKPVSLMRIAEQMEWQARERIGDRDGPVDPAQERQRNRAQNLAGSKPFTQRAGRWSGQGRLHGGRSSKRFVQLSFRSLKSWLTPAVPPLRPYSHSIVPGGLLVMS